MCDQTKSDYEDGDVVWVKLGSVWWPGEVCAANRLPDGMLAGLRKLPMAVVKFFQENTYEYVKNLSDIYRYHCARKNEFIKKGLDLYRSNNAYMQKFPGDVCIAERRTGGNPNIIASSEFAPNEKPDYSSIFGATKRLPKASSVRGRPPGSGKTNVKRVIHSPYINKSDHVSRIMSQSPSKSKASTSTAVKPDAKYNCQFCDFYTNRLNVIVLHSKNHTSKVAGTSAEKRQPTPAKKPMPPKIIEPATLYERQEFLNICDSSFDSDDDTTTTTTTTTTTDSIPSPSKYTPKKRTVKPLAINSSEKRSRQQVAHTKTSPKLTSKLLEKKQKTEIKKTLLADWSDSDDENQKDHTESADNMNESTAGGSLKKSTNAADTEATATSAVIDKPKYRNIPKKDRRKLDQFFDDSGLDQSVAAPVSVIVIDTDESDGDDTRKQAKTLVGLGADVIEENLQRIDPDSIEEAFETIPELLHDDKLEEQAEIAKELNDKDTVPEATPIEQNVEQKSIEIVPVEEKEMSRRSKSFKNKQPPLEKSSPVQEEEKSIVKTVENFVANSLTTVAIDTPENEDMKSEIETELIVAANLSDKPEIDEPISRADGSIESSQNDDQISKDIILQENEIKFEIEDAAVITEEDNVANENYCNEESVNQVESDRTTLEVETTKSFEAEARSISPLILREKTPEMENNDRPTDVQSEFDDSRNDPVHDGFEEASEDVVSVPDKQHINEEDVDSNIEAETQDLHEEIIASGVFEDEDDKNSFKGEIETEKSFDTDEKFEEISNDNQNDSNDQMMDVQPKIFTKKHRKEKSKKQLPRPSATDNSISPQFDDESSRNSNKKASRKRNAHHLIEIMSAGITRRSTRRRTIPSPSSPSPEELEEIVKKIDEKCAAEERRKSMYIADVSELRTSTAKSDEQDSNESGNHEDNLVLSQPIQQPQPPQVTETADIQSVSSVSTPDKSSDSTKDLDCFAFTEEEDEEIPKKLSRKKRRCYPPGKMFDLETMDAGDFQQQHQQQRDTVEDDDNQQSLKEKEENDKRLATEIDNLLIATSSTILELPPTNFPEPPAEKYPDKMISVQKEDDTRDRSLPPKERNKRIFKSRNRHRSNEMDATSDQHQRLSSSEMNRENRSSIESGNTIGSNEEKSKSESSDTTIASAKSPDTCRENLELKSSPLQVVLQEALNMEQRRLKKMKSREIDTREPQPITKPTESDIQVAEALINMPLYPTEKRISTSETIEQQNEKESNVTRPIENKIEIDVLGQSESQTTPILAADSDIIIDAQIEPSTDLNRPQEFADTSKKEPTPLRKTTASLALDLTRIRDENAIDSELTKTPVVEIPLPETKPKLTLLCKIPLPKPELSIISLRKDKIADGPTSNEVKKSEIVTQPSPKVKITAVNVPIEQKPTDEGKVTRKPTVTNVLHEIRVTSPLSITTDTTNIQSTVPVQKPSPKKEAGIVLKATPLPKDVYSSALAKDHLDATSPKSTNKKIIISKMRGDDSSFIACIPKKRKSTVEMDDDIPAFFIKKPNHSESPDKEAPLRKDTLLRKDVKSNRPMSTIIKVQKASELTKATPQKVAAASGSSAVTQKSQVIDIQNLPILFSDSLAADNLEKVPFVLTATKDIHILPTDSTGGAGSNSAPNISVATTSHSEPSISIITLNTSAASSKPMVLTSSNTIQKFLFTKGKIKKMQPTAPSPLTTAAVAASTSTSQLSSVSTITKPAQIMFTTIVLTTSTPSSTSPKLSVSLAPSNLPPDTSNSQNKRKRTTRKPTKSDACIQKQIGIDGQGNPVYAKCKPTSSSAALKLSKPLTTSVQSATSNPISIDTLPASSVIPKGTIVHAGNGQIVITSKGALITSSTQTETTSRLSSLSVSTTTSIHHSTPHKSDAKLQKTILSPSRIQVQSTKIIRSATPTMPQVSQPKQHLLLITKKTQSVPKTDTTVVTTVSAAQESSVTPARSPIVSALRDHPTMIKMSPQKFAEMERLGFIEDIPDGKILTPTGYKTIHNPDNPIPKKTIVKRISRTTSSSSPSAAPSPPATQSQVIITTNQTSEMPPLVPISPARENTNYLKTPSHKIVTKPQPQQQTQPSPSPVVTAPAASTLTTTTTAAATTVSEPPTSSKNRTETVVSELVADVTPAAQEQPSLTQQLSQTQDLLALPGDGFGGPPNSYFLCTLGENGTFIPIDNQPLYLDSSNQLIPSLPEGEVGPDIQTMQTFDDLNQTQIIQQQQLLDYGDGDTVMATDQDLSQLQDPNNPTYLINTNDGQQILLDQQGLLALTAGGDIPQFMTADGQQIILPQDLLSAISLNEDVGLTAGDQILIPEELALIQDQSTNQDILAAALAGTEAFTQEQFIGDMLIHSPNGDIATAETMAFHALTQPAATALTSATNAVLTQPPIMSTLEQPTKTDKISPNSSHDLSGQNLDESLAVIGVNTHTNIPTSLELPITITNPAIAAKTTSNPISLASIYPASTGPMIGLTSTTISSASENELSSYDLFNTTIGQPMTQALSTNTSDHLIITNNGNVSPNTMDIDSNSDIIPVTPESATNHHHSPDISGFTPDNSNSSSEIPLQPNLVLRAADVAAAAAAAAANDDVSTDVEDEPQNPDDFSDARQYIDDQTLASNVAGTFSDGSYNSR